MSVWQYNLEPSECECVCVIAGYVGIRCGSRTYGQQSVNVCVFVCDSRVCWDIGMSGVAVEPRANRVLMCVCICVCVRQQGVVPVCRVNRVLHVLVYLCDPLTASSVCMCGQVKHYPVTLTAGLSIL